jgi:hypothetical protein
MMKEGFGMQPPIAKDQKPENVAARFRTAIELFDLSVEMMEQTLWRRFPDDTPERHDWRMKAWMRRPRHKNDPLIREGTWPR